MSNNDLIKELIEYGFVQEENVPDCFSKRIDGTNLIYRTNIQSKVILLIVDSKYINNQLHPSIPEYNLECILFNYYFITGQHLTKDKDYPSI